MTSVTFNDGAHEIRVTGHSGYAEQGKDIVCAGVSALSWALVAALHREGLLLEAVEGDGYMTIRYLAGAEKQLEMFQIGLEMMEAKYPENVVTQGRKLLLFDDTITGKGGNS